MKKLTHAITGAVYEQQEDGTVKVTDADGSVGYFHSDGRHVAGELRYADPHMIDWLGMPQATNSFGRMAGAQQQAESQA